MRYLKKYNEELRSGTYQNAAKKLRTMGHERRAGDLEKWSEEMNIRAQKKREQETFERISKFPPFEMEVRQDKWNSQTRQTTMGTESIVKGNFYLDIDFTSDMFDDHVYYWVQEKMSGTLNIFLDMGIYPADEDAMKSLKDNQSRLHEHIWDNMMWGTWIIITITENGKDLDESVKTSVELESREGDTILFANRREALKFKRLLVAHFEGKNDFGASKWSPKGPAGKIKEIIEGEERFYTDDTNLEDRNEIEWIRDKYEGSPIRAEHYQKVVDAVKRMSLNDLYRD